MIFRRDFSLIELMIAVALVGILASIAITNVAEMHLKAKRGELPLNVNGIKTAEIVYEASYDTFIASDGWMPSINFGKSLRDWQSDASFAALGWEPDGQVRGAYGVTASKTNLTIWGQSDVDGDGNYAAFEATKSTNATLMAHVQPNWY